MYVKTKKKKKGGEVEVNIFSFLLIWLLLSLLTWTFFPFHRVSDVAGVLIHTLCLSSGIFKNWTPSINMIQAILFPASVDCNNLPHSGIHYNSLNWLLEKTKQNKTKPKKNKQTNKQTNKQKQKQTNKTKQNKTKTKTKSVHVSK